MKQKKIRADLLVDKQGLCESIDIARKYILAGQIRIGTDFVVQKSSDLFSQNIEFNLQETSKYVSRGAYKLLPALKKYSPNLKNKIGLDIGASTGGFTDLMLQFGAKKVYTVDCGTNQLHYKLRCDKRIVCYEKTNARYLENDFLTEKVDVLTMDVSFISVTKLLSSTIQFLNKAGLAYILIKPQFEARREDVSKGGIVIDKKIHTECIEKVAKFAKKELDMEEIEVFSSPIKGPKGNQEYVLVLRFPQDK